MTVRKLPIFIGSMMCLSLTPLFAAGHTSSTTHTLTAMNSDAPAVFTSMDSSSNDATMLAATDLLNNNNDVVGPQLSAFVNLQQAELETVTMHSPESMDPHAMAQQTVKAPVAKTAQKPAQKPATQPKKTLSSRSSDSPIEVALSSIGGSAAAYSERFIGVPYVWGGSTPSSGFDCSGFVAYVYRHFGIFLPHSSYAQMGCGQSVSRGQLSAGDLVFFDGASHVGIYLGGGMFIHAPHPGSSVRIDSLSGYWGRNFCGARRIR